MITFIKNLNIKSIILFATNYDKLMQLIDKLIICTFLTI